MSWSRSFKSLEDFMHDIGDPPLPLDGDAMQQIGIARQAAERIIVSRAVGGNGSLQRADSVQGANDKDFSITLAGHSNPNHEPKAGWANDTITVTVTQKS
jgi:hypothetical protein